MRRHSRTLRLPLEVFDAEEKPCLFPAPISPYDVPLWCEPKVGRDHYAQVAKALYSLPSKYIGKRVCARADKQLVRFYEGGALIKTHARQPAGGRATDPSDFPPEKTAYAMRDVAFLERQAETHGAAVGRYAKALLDCPLPWTRMRRVYGLLALAKKYGDERLEKVCAIALDVQMIDVKRLGRMLELGELDAPPEKAAPPKVIPMSRYLRPVEQYALPFSKTAKKEE
jgi:hypothetical protein